MIVRSGRSGRGQVMGAALSHVLRVGMLGV